MWLPLAVLAGCAFLIAAFVAEQHESLARVLLLVFGAALVASGVYFGVSWVAGRAARWPSSRT